MSTTARTTTWDYFIKSSLWNAKTPSKSKVKDAIPKMVVTSLAAQEHDLFIVGVDLDDADFPPELEKHKSEEKDIKSRIPKGIDSEKVVVFIPIQAIDYWLYYQAANKKPPVPNSLEAKGRPEIKRLLYGTTNPNGYKIQSAVDALMRNFDQDELCKQSASFKHFHEQITRFCENQK